MQNPQLGYSFCFSATIGEETNEAKESNTVWVQQYIWDVYSWNTLNNLRTQEPRAMIFAPHVF